MWCLLYGCGKATSVVNILHIWYFTAIYVWAFSKLQCMLVTCSMRWFRRIQSLCGRCGTSSSTYFPLNLIYIYMHTIHVCVFMGLKHRDWFFGIILESIHQNKLLIGYFARIKKGRLDNNNHTFLGPSFTFSCPFLRCTLKQISRFVCCHKRLLFYYVVNWC